MNEEIAMRTLAYLITHYKEHDETIINSEEIQAIEYLQQENQQLKNNWNELKKFIEKEQDRLARECSQIYEDSLGKTKLVNEDIFNEIKNISNKMQELEGNDE